MTVDEYLTHTSLRGQRWSVITEERRLLITSQPGWELEVFIEEIPNSPVFKLWRIKDWQFHKANNMELVAETKRLDEKESLFKHNTLMAWRNIAIETLVTKGKLSRERAIEHINLCITPTNAKDEKSMKFYFDLRTKLGWPFKD